MEEDSNRVVCSSKYNYYQYYNINKIKYRLHYQDKLIRDKQKKEDEAKKTYNRDYWLKQLYIPENLEQYLKSKK